ncbi:glycosyltransferase family 39 protein [Aestuariivirga litoralis]|uniref:glycosyltransferase family 39 protein n=1 Tax=Aestuariivirga litoralis TaxID=2650924 RepID=UPI0018C84B75|nr:hypothetical protein [Aestuariivirga litoralis]MBG1230920.1 glycosyltransferase family 39 protein [Aestuariivirga litoralis]
MISQIENPNSLKPKALHTALFLLVVAVVGYCCYRESSVRHFFWADDWDWIYNAEFRSYSEIFSLVPRSAYNDRPVGAVIIKAAYYFFGLNHQYFLLLQIAIHWINCVLLYLISKRHIGNTVALIAAGLAGSWMASDIAVYWTAAMFDLAGATLCLVSIYVWQLRENKYRFVYILASAAAYFLAVRTKEFSVGLPILIFAIGFLLEKKPIAQLAKDIVPYAAVMILLALRYAFLIMHSDLLTSSSNVYRLDFTSLVSNLWFYFSYAFYVEAFGPYPAVAAAFAFVIAGVISAEYRHLLGVGLLGFVTLLGPTLLLTSHRDPLYLYAPHFFMAFVIAAGASLGMYWKAFSVIFSILLVVFPLSSAWFMNVLNYHDTKSIAILSQYQSFFNTIGRPERSSSIFISGLETYFNPFSAGPGDSLKIVTKDQTLKVVVEKPDDELRAGFCAAAAPKYFVVYDGNVAKNETEGTLAFCPH